MKSIVRRPLLAFALGLAFAAAAFAGSEAWARLGATQAASETIHACVKPNGTIYLVDATKACKKNETKVSWNMEGPKGDQGDPGPQGPAGPEGAQGPQGPAGRQARQGAKGATGDKGDKGDTGATEPARAGGCTRRSGRSRRQGRRQGDKGDTGDTGPQGPRVRTELHGAPGAPGATGPTQGRRGRRGPQAAAANLTSPNGLYKITVTDAGILLKGPGGTVKIDRGAVSVKGYPYVDIQGADRP